MANQHADITPELHTFIEAQSMFFVATAPNGDGRINMSPKGLDSFRVLSPTSVCYLDLTGSGVETIAHLRENGRITFMFVSFTGGPNIVRLYGSGEVIRPDHADFDELRSLFGDFDAVRSVIRADITSTSDSCGYGVPLMTVTGDRRTLPAWAAKKTPDEIDAYHQNKTAHSIDGLPGMVDL